ncbi:MAG: queuosine salvage family protein [Solirubrobacteraceae bacterium]
MTAQLAAPPDPEAELLTGDRETRAGFWLCLDAINFGSGWFPTLRKRPGRSGYFAVAIGVRERFARDGAMDAATLSGIEAAEVAEVLGQDPGHPLMALFAAALRDVGHHVDSEHEGSFAAVVDAAAGRAVVLVDKLAAWDAFADTSSFQELRVPFLKRAQITAADLHRSGVADFIDLEQLTLFADNLVPHVLRVDEMLSYEPALLARIERGEQLEHGSPEEVAIRACALHAVELLSAQLPGTRACDLDLTLWNRGQAARYRAISRHRTRCTAY